MKVGELMTALGGDMELVMAITENGILYNIKDVDVEYDPDSRTTTCWLKLEEF